MQVDIAHLSKSYAGVHALADVSMTLESGEIHALCGANGAGKSTLIKCLSGVVVPDQGTLYADGEPLPVGRVHASEEAGVAVIHQESTIFPDLTIPDNLFVGRPIRRAGNWLLDRSAMRRRSAEVLERMGQSLDLDRPAGEFSVGQRKIISIARALLSACRCLILDEPTAALSQRETNRLLQIVRNIRDEGITVLFVSHRIDEVFALCDRVSVLRDGRHVATTPRPQLNRKRLVMEMVGDTNERASGGTTTLRQPGEPVLRVARLSASNRLRDVELTVHAGEIVGLAGLVGAGRSELLRAIFGADRYDEGEIRVGDDVLAPGRIDAAIAAGVALVPEDRQHDGLVLPLSIATNLTLASLGMRRLLGHVSYRWEKTIADQACQRWQIKAASTELPVETLSGGNQQKTVLGKWIATRPRLLLLDEPTCGVDIRSKEEVHRWIIDRAGEGVATLVASSETEELLALCDRILVLCEGRLTAEFTADAATPQAILDASLPGGVGI